MLLGSFVLLVFVAGLESHPVGSQGPCNQVQDVLQALEDSSIPPHCKGRGPDVAASSGYWTHAVMDIAKDCYDDKSCYDQFKHE